MVLFSSVWLDVVVATVVLLAVIVVRFGAPAYRKGENPFGYGPH